MATATPTLSRHRPSEKPSLCATVTLTRFLLTVPPALLKDLNLTSPVPGFLAQCPPPRLSFASRYVVFDCYVVLHYISCMPELQLTKEALRALRRMDKAVATAVREKIDQYSGDPTSLAANVKRLKGGSRFLRLRVGDYRVIMDDHDKTNLLVVKIGHRSDVYG
jgi:mRNA interferase RelE/StbE